MTEREYHREPDPAPTTSRRDVYQETQVNATGDPAQPAHGIYQERISGPGGEQVVRSEHISVPSEATRRAAAVDRARQVIYFIFGAIEALLAIRFVLLLLGANQGSPFVNLIYSLSRPFVLPFQGIFGEPTFDSSVVEWSSLVGMIVYTLIAYGLVRLIELIYAPTPTRDT